MNSNNDISFIDLHRYITYLISSKKMDLDQETKDYIQDLQDNFFILKDFQIMSEEELIQKRIQITEKFLSQMNDIKEKFQNLKLIKEILEIDLSYYYNKLKVIKNILKNDNFKVSINIINNKISTNQELNNTDKQQITFYSKLLNQKVYIEKIILSDKMIFKTSKKDLIKKQLFIEMKNIQEQTKIYIQENKQDDFDYKKILDSYNDYELVRLLDQLNETIFEDKNESLRYKIIQNLKILTGKSYKEISLILKDNKFKQKLFGNLKIETINQKLNDLSNDMNHYNNIKNFIDENKKITHVCPLCNYSHDMGINIILHLSLHKTNKYTESISFIFYNLDNNLYSTFSSKKIVKLEDFKYNMKMRLLNDKNITKDILYEDINKGSFEDMRQPISLNKIIQKVDNMKRIEDFEKSMVDKNKEYKNFNINVKKIVKNQVENMKKNLGNNVTKNIRIINFNIFKNIFDKFLNQDDIINLYNSVIEYYDNELKTDSGSSFDLLFKNIIHYNNKKPIEEIYYLMKKLFKIISGVQEREYSKLLYILGTNKIQGGESYEYVDTKVLTLLIPLLKSNDLLSNIKDNLNDDEDDDIKIDNYNLDTWTSSKNYKKLINKLSNITKDDLIITTYNDKQTEEILNEFNRLRSMFKNIKNIQKIEKQYDLIFKSFVTMINNNMFLHDISDIENNKNIQEKYNEYMNGTFLLITLNYMNILKNENKDNVENTKQMYNIFFRTLSLYLREDSKYLKKNTVVKRKVVRKQEQQILDNRDDLLNEYFESDDEDFNEEIVNENKDIFDDDNEEESDLMEDLFGDEE